MEKNKFHSLTHVLLIDFAAMKRKLNSKSPVDNAVSFYGLICYSKMQCARGFVSMCSQCALFFIFFASLNLFFGVRGKTLSVGDS